MERRLSIILNARGFLKEIAPQAFSAQAEESSLAQAQRDIYDSHRHRIFSLAYHMTGNELEAERLLTDSFVLALSTDPKPNGAVIDQSLVAQLRKQFSLAPTTSAAPDTGGMPMRKNVRRTDLEEAIQELPPSERLLFLLRDVEGYSSEAVSQLLEMPQPQVSRTLISARIRLRGILSNMEARRTAA